MPSDQLIGVDASGTERPMRECTRAHNDLEIGCGQVDDHPRHVVDDGDAGQVQFHLDCHAHGGCRSCRAQIAGRPDGAAGQEMLDHILTRAGQTLDAENATLDDPQEG